MESGLIYQVKEKMVFLAAHYFPVRIASSYIYKQVSLQKKYPLVAKRLAYYKKETSLLSSKILKMKKDIVDLRGKIEMASHRVKTIKNKIKKDDLTIRKIIRRIFFFQKEYDSVKLSSFKNNADYFVLNYQMKDVINREEGMLSKLAARKNKLLKMKEYLNKEKIIFISVKNGFKISRKKIKVLIAEMNNYIKVLKTKHGTKDKKNRFLKHKVIKLIHNLNKRSKKNDITFTILR